MTDLSGGRDQLGIAPMSSQRVHLRPIHPQDYPFLYELALEPELGLRWRFRGEQPTFEDFVRGFGASVFCQYLITNRVTKARVGHAVCYQAHRANGHAYIGLHGIPDARNSGRLVEAGRMFITYLFEAFGFKKLYAECPEFNLEAFRSGLSFGDAIVQEGRLRKHEFYAGRSWDLYVFAIYREAWEREWNRFSTRVADSAGPHQQGRSGQILAIEEFCHYLETVMDLDGGTVVADASFETDLGFDSVQVFELLCAVEELGVLIPDGVMQDMRTVSDLHFHYIQAAPLAN